MTMLPCIVCGTDFHVDRLPYPEICPCCCQKYAAKWRRALMEIASCPEPNSVEDCHDKMFDIACAALVSARGSVTP
jgi:hypothetical protein